MNSITFVKNQINELVERFTNIKCSYDHDKSFYTHYIEIIPSSEFKNNKNLNNYLDDLFFDFIDIYPKESITFLTEDSLIKLDKIVYEKSGSNYQTILETWGSLTDFPEETSEIRINNIPSFEIDYSIEFALAA